MATAWVPLVASPDPGKTSKGILEDPRLQSKTLEIENSQCWAVKVTNYVFKKLPVLDFCVMSK